MKTRKIVISLLTLLAVVCMAFSVVMMTKTNSSIAYATSMATAGEFYVEDGASVRTEDEETAGIRFTTIMTEEFYNSVKDSSPSWNTLISFENEDEPNMVIGEEGVFQVNVGTIEPHARWIGNELHYVYQVVLSYANPNATEEQMAQMYAMNVSARSYVQVGEEIIYSYADGSTDTHRNVSEVAESVLMNDILDAGIYQQPEMVGAKAILTNYINSQTKIYAIEELGYIEDFSLATDDTLIVPGVADGHYKAKLGDTRFEVDVLNGEATIANTANNPLGLTLGDTYVISLAKEGGFTYAMAVKAVSKVIDSEEEFINDYYKYYSTTEDVTLYYDGATASVRYYVVSRDLNLLSTSLMSDGTTKISKAYENARSVTTRTYRDVLDGQGHTITADIFFEQYGLFLNVKASAVFKNLAFNLGVVNHDTNTTSRVIFKQAEGGMTLENVYFDINKTANCMGGIAIFGYNDNGLTAKDVYINVDEALPKNVNLFMSTTYCNSSLFPSRFNITNYNAVTGDVANHKVFVHSGNTVFAGNDGIPQGVENESWDCYCSDVVHTAGGNVFTDPDLFRFDTAEEMIAYGHDVVGNWVINADGTASWVEDVSYLNDVNDYTHNNSAESKVTTTIAENVTALGYYEDFSAYTDDTLKVSVADGAYDVTINNVTVNGVAIESGVATIAQGAFGLEQSALGTEVLVAMAKDGFTYYQTVKFVSKTIDSEEEFLLEYYNYYSTTEDLTLFYDGATVSARYIVLTRDINLLSSATLSDGSATISNKYNSLRNTTTRAYYDILDGQGYTLTADVFFEQYALFMNVKASAAYKNVKLDLGMAYNDTNTTERAIFKAFAGTLDNVYIDLNKTNKTAGIVNVFYSVSDGMTAKNVFINVDENIETAVNLYVRYSVYNGYTFVNEPKYTISNYVAITTGAKHKAFSHQGDRSIWSATDGVPTGSENGSWDCHCGVAHTANNQFFTYSKFYRYDSAELAAADGFTSVGDWTINENGTASWQGASHTVPSENTQSISYVTYVEPTALTDVGYLEDFFKDADKTFSNLAVADGTYNITLNGVTYENIEVAGGIATINGNLNLTLGNAYNLMISDGTHVYVQPIKYVSQIIDDATEMTDMLKYYNTVSAEKYYDGATFTQRYYLLNADVSIGTGANSESSKLYDIFDGNGHKVTTTIYWSSIWYTIKSNAVVKNVQFSVHGDWYEGQTQTRAVLARKVESGAKIENVAIKVSASTQNQKGSFSVIGYTMAYASLKNVYINTGALKMNEEVEATTYYGYISAANWDVIYLNNVHVVSQMGYATKFGSGDENPKAWVAENEEMPTLEGYSVRQHTGLYHYTAATVMQVGNWSIDAGGVATWSEQEAITLGGKLDSSQIMAIGESKAIEFADGVTEGATVTVSGDSVAAQGLEIFAVKSGASTVTVTRGSDKAVFTIVTASKTDTFKAVASSTQINPGEKATISISDVSGAAYAGKVAYATLDPKVVSVSADGVITAITNGTATVTAAFQVGGTVATKTVEIIVGDGIYVGPTIDQILVGKNISFIGDSITTYEGVSNVGTVNTTISGYDVHYKTTHMTQADTWWQQTADQTAMNVLVNNSYSGSSVTDVRGAGKAWETRAVNLHDNTLDNNEGGVAINPDIIAVYIGINDTWSGTVSTSTVMDDAFWARIESAGYTPASLDFAEAYALMIYKMTVAYPDAEIFLFTLPISPTSKLNDVIRATAEHYGLGLVELTDTSLAGDSERAYTQDGTHPNAAGMDIITERFIEALEAKYLG